MVARASGSPLQSEISNSIAVAGRPRPDGPHRGRESAGAAVGQVVAGHCGDHGVGQAEPGHRLGHPPGLVGVGWQRLAGVDQAEPAGPGAPVAVDHERGRAVGPALVDVRAAGLLANCHQVQLAQGPAQRPVLLAHAGLDPQPFGFALVQGHPAGGIDPRLGQPLVEHANRYRVRPGAGAGAGRTGWPGPAPRVNGARSAAATRQATSWRSTWS